MRRYLLRLSYLGTRYRGFQKQNIDGSPLYQDPYTICGLLELALKGCDPKNHPVVVGSSRTDKGVHALCNTVHVDLEENKDRISALSIVRQCNNFFEFNDHDVRVLTAQPVENDFHCRYNSQGRTYVYRFAVHRPGVSTYRRLEGPWPITELNRTYIFQSPTFNPDAVRNACDIFVGTKDFAAVSSKSTERKEANKSTVREVYSLTLDESSPFLASKELDNNVQFWSFTCKGKSFLFHQVRKMVSALLSYGVGRTPIEDLHRLIDEPVPSSWKSEFSMVPAHGLYLVDVWYRPEDLEFKCREEDLKLAALQEECDKIHSQLQHFEGPILEKINLKKRLLILKKAIASS